jgi:hypothetical protein
VVHKEAQVTVEVTFRRQGASLSRPRANATRLADDANPRSVGYSREDGILDCIGTWSVTFRGLITIAKIVGCD